MNAATQGTGGRASHVNQTGGRNTARSGLPGASASTARGSTATPTIPTATLSEAAAGELGTLRSTTVGLLSRHLAEPLLAQPPSSPPSRRNRMDGNNNGSATSHHHLLAAGAGKGQGQMSQAEIAATAEFFRQLPPETLLLYEGAAASAEREKQERGGGGSRTPSPSPSPAAAAPSGDDRITARTLHLLLGKGRAVAEKMMPPSWANAGGERSRYYSFAPTKKCSAAAREGHDHEDDDDDGSNNADRGGSRSVMASVQAMQTELKIREPPAITAATDERRFYHNTNPNANSITTDELPAGKTTTNANDNGDRYTSRPTTGADRGLEYPPVPVQYASLDAKKYALARKRLGLNSAAAAAGAPPSLLTSGKKKSAPLTVAAAAARRGGGGRPTADGGLSNGLLPDIRAAVNPSSSSPRAAAADNSNSNDGDGDYHTQRQRWVEQANSTIDFDAFDMPPSRRPPAVTAAAAGGKAAQGRHGGDLGGAAGATLQFDLTAAAARGEDSRIIAQLVALYSSQLAEQRLANESNPLTTAAVKGLAARSSPSPSRQQQQGQQAQQQPSTSPMVEAILSVSCEYEQARRNTVTPSSIAAAAGGGGGAVAGGLSAGRQAESARLTSLGRTKIPEQYWVAVQKRTTVSILATAGTSKAAKGNAATHHHHNPSKKPSNPTNAADLSDDDESELDHGSTRTTLTTTSTATAAVSRVPRRGFSQVGDGDYSGGDARASVTGAGGASRDGLVVFPAPRPTGRAQVYLLAETIDHMLRADPSWLRTLADPRIAYAVLPPRQEDNRGPAPHPAPPLRAAAAVITTAAVKAARVRVPRHSSAAAAAAAARPSGCAPVSVTAGDDGGVGGPSAVRATAAAPGNDDNDDGTNTPNLSAIMESFLREQHAAAAAAATSAAAAAVTLSGNRNSSNTVSSYNANEYDNGDGYRHSGGSSSLLDPEVQWRSCAAHAQYTAAATHVLGVLDMGLVEVVRQVAVHCAERGALLDALRQMVVDLAGSHVRVLARAKERAYDEATARCAAREELDAVQSRLTAALAVITGLEAAARRTAVETEEMAAKAERLDALMARVEAKVRRYDVHSADAHACLLWEVERHMRGAAGEALAVIFDEKCRLAGFTDGADDDDDTAAVGASGSAAAAAAIGFSFSNDGTSLSSSSSPNTASASPIHGSSSGGAAAAAVTGGESFSLTALPAMPTATAKRTGGGTLVRGGGGPAIIAEAPSATAARRDVSEHRAAAGSLYAQSCHLLHAMRAATAAVNAASAPLYDGVVLASVSPAGNVATSRWAAVARAVGAFERDRAHRQRVFDVFNAWCGCYQRRAARAERQQQRRRGLLALPGSSTRRQQSSSGGGEGGGADNNHTSGGGPVPPPILDADAAAAAPRRGGHFLLHDPTDSSDDEDNAGGGDGSANMSNSSSSSSDGNGDSDSDSGSDDSSGSDKGNDSKDDASLIGSLSKKMKKGKDGRRRRSHDSTSAGAVPLPRLSAGGLPSHRSSLQAEAQQTVMHFRQQERELAHTSISNNTNKSLSRNSSAAASSGGAVTRVTEIRHVAAVDLSEMAVADCTAAEVNALFAADFDFAAYLNPVMGGPAADGPADAADTFHSQNQHKIINKSNKTSNGGGHNTVAAAASAGGGGGVGSGWTLTLADVAQMMRDVQATLEEITLRMRALAESAILRRGVEPPIPAPARPEDPCGLCGRRDAVADEKKRRQTALRQVAKDVQTRLEGLTDKCRRAEAEREEARAEARRLLADLTSVQALHATLRQAVPGGGGASAAAAVAMAASASRGGGGGGVLSLMSPVSPQDSSAGSSTSDSALPRSIFKKRTSLRSSSGGGMNSRKVSGGTPSPVSVLHGRRTRLPTAVPTWGDDAAAPPATGRPSSPDIDTLVLPAPPLAGSGAGESPLPAVLHASPVSAPSVSFPKPPPGVDEAGEDNDDDKESESSLSGTIRRGTLPPRSTHRVSFQGHLDEAPL